MPNVSKRPADADKLDPQEQLKKLREALLRDAAARESDGENEAEESADSAINRKKEAAARRFAGASGGSAAGASNAAAGGSSASSTSSQAAKKNVQKGVAGSPSSLPSSSRDQSQSKGASGATPVSRDTARRKDERGGLALLSTLLSEKTVGPNVSSNSGDRRDQSANARVSSQGDSSGTKRAASNPPVTDTAKPRVHPAADAFAQQRAAGARPTPAKAGQREPESRIDTRGTAGQPLTSTRPQERREPDGKVARARERAPDVKHTAHDARSQARPGGVEKVVAGRESARNAHQPKPIAADPRLERREHNARADRIPEGPRGKTQSVTGSSPQSSGNQPVVIADHVSERGSRHLDDSERPGIVSEPSRDASRSLKPSAAAESDLSVTQHAARTSEHAESVNQQLGSGRPQDRTESPTVKHLARNPGRGPSARERTRNGPQDVETGASNSPVAQHAAPKPEHAESSAEQQRARRGPPDAESGAASAASRPAPQGARPPKEARASQNAQQRSNAQTDAVSQQRRDTPRPRRVVEPNPIPPIRFPETLPVSARRDEIAAAIQANQVVIVSGETGSGKTTQLPKICLALGRGLGAGGSGLIGHTQPRRIAASATGRRIAEELGTPFGEVVGYKVRFTDNLSPGASVKLMTDGILLAETQTDPLLAAYDTIIIDEAHERSLNIDFLLGYLREILPRRPDLKVIVTSATIDADRFARHFGSDEKSAPVIEVSGRLYPVEVRYRPVEEESPAVKAAQGTTPGTQQKDRPDRPKNQRENDRDLMEAIVDAVDELCREGPGDVLVFLPGEREIRDAAEALRNTIRRIPKSCRCSLVFPQPSRSACSRRRTRGG